MDPPQPSNDGAVKRPSTWISERYTGTSKMPRVRTSLATLAVIPSSSGRKLAVRSISRERSRPSCTLVTTSV
jgi:hypothetical protein